MEGDSPSDAFDRPVVILGAPRSGTTFLAEVLSAHQEFACVIEPSPVWRYGNECRSDCLKPELATDRVRSHVRSHFRRILRAKGKPRLLEKTPQNSLRPEFVDAILPEARYLHILRHGCEASLSIRSQWLSNTRGFRGVRIGQRLKELSLPQVPRYGWQAVLRSIGSLTGRGLVPWGPLLPGIREMAAELDLIEVAALQWRTCVESACAFGRSLPPERYLEFKIEDLDTGKLEVILAFCGIGSDPAVIDRFERGFELENARHRTDRAAEGEIERLRRLLEPTLRWLDYSP